jgi:hypothetical protein
MTDSPTLPQLLDDAAFLSLEHQLHLSERLGEHGWQADLDQPRLEFTGERPLVCDQVHLLGSAAPGPQSWLWAWANPSGYSDQVVAASAAVRDFALQHQIFELAAPEVPFSALPGEPSEPAQVVGIITDAAKAITNKWSSYNAEIGGGSRASFLIEHDELRLPAPDGPRVMRVIEQGLSGLTLHDHRRALYGYATRRGLGAEFAAGHATLAITGPTFEATVTFDDLGRASNIHSTLRPPA